MSISRRGLFAMFAAPFTALAAAREVDAAVRLSAKPAGGRAQTCFDTSAYGANESH